MMTTIEKLLKEMDQEAETTRKMLSRVPNDKYDWQPHEKSMTIRRLATHIADIPSWVEMAICDDELDFATSTHKEPVINKTDELLSFFEESQAKGKAALANAKEELFDLPWTMRNGEQIYAVYTKGEVVRMAYNQTVHHRAQLGVFLRLLDVPIPGSYGPSADDGGF
ncbi:MAG: damage-inducible protein DinB [Mucilaginibacter sp.]|nr:damage-inducible protein DinB [Mucilaginibacter sp.]